MTKEHKYTASRTPWSEGGYSVAESENRWKSLLWHFNPPGLEFRFKDWSMRCRVEGPHAPGIFLLKLECTTAHPWSNRKAEDRYMSIQLPFCLVFAFTNSLLFPDDFFYTLKAHLVSKNCSDEDLKKLQIYLWEQVQDKFISYYALEEAEAPFPSLGVKPLNIRNVRQFAQAAWGYQEYELGQMIDCRLEPCIQIIKDREFTVELVNKYIE